jgi:hypothetical protein
LFLPVNIHLSQQKIFIFLNYGNMKSKEKILVINNQEDEDGDNIYPGYMDITKNGKIDLHDQRVNKIPGDVTSLSPGPLAAASGPEV